MEQMAEFPESSIVCHAEQFLDAALLLLRNIPVVVTPSPLVVNAAFAIELFLKSLNSHWELHALGTTDDLGIEIGFEVTAKSNATGHRLKQLFNAVPKTVRDELSSAFGRDALARRYSSIEDILSRYSDAFTGERYSFESRRTGDEVCPLREIVDFATFLRNFIKSIPVRRYGTC